MPSARLLRPLLLAATVALTLAAAGCGDKTDPPTGSAQFAAASVAPSGVAPAPSSAAPSAAPTSAGPVAIPAGVTAGIVIYDRQARAYVLQQKAGWRFRSASLVKLLIALDYFWSKGPSYAVPAADQPKLQVMLRS